MTDEEIDLVISSDELKYRIMSISKKFNGIDKKDLLSVQSKVFGYANFDDLKTSAADINKDGTVDKKDLLAVQSHVFGYSQIKQE